MHATMTDETQLKELDDIDLKRAHALPFAPTRRSAFIAGACWRCAGTGFRFWPGNKGGWRGGGKRVVEVVNAVRATHPALHFLRMRARSRHTGDSVIDPKG